MTLVYYCIGRLFVKRNYVTMGKNSKKTLTLANAVSYVEAAKLVGVHHRTIYNARKLGKLRAYPCPLTGRWMLDKRDVVRWARLPYRLGRPRGS